MRSPGCELLQCNIKLKEREFLLERCDRNAPIGRELYAQTVLSFRFTAPRNVKMGVLDLKVRDLVV